MQKNMNVFLVCLCACCLLISCKVDSTQKDMPREDVPVETKAPEVKQEVIAAPTPQAQDEKTILMVLDFDSGNKPNNLGGDLGAWDKDPADETQTCAIIFEAGDDALGNENGYSLRLTYDVDSPNPAYNGFWTKLEGEDLSNYSVLNFYIKGDATQGFTTKLKIEIKDFQNRVARYLLSGITAEWQKVSIPFEKIPGMNRLDTTSMNELVIVFDDVNCSPKSGSILLDQVYISKN
ncbi:carbohydrate binding domain-containing protein [Candidatus Omnitrophota bacterium]